MRPYDRHARVMRLTSLDLILIAVYLAGITAFGIALRRGQSTVRDYFLGGRTAPWWALAFSIVATETSTLTIVGTPALAFAGNLTFLQLVLGYLAGRVVIVLVFLPRYFRGEYYTAYQLMERRFGAKVKAVAASTFLVTRALAEGVRIAAIGFVIKAAFGTGQRTSVLLIVALVLIYTFEGGMKAVIWTDVVQFLLYFSCSIASFFLLLHAIPGGWTTVMHAASTTDKFRMFDFSFSFTNPAKTYTFWSGMIGGTFLTMASHGTDQTIVQRLLAAKSERESKIALLASGGIILFQFALFLVLGVMLYAWHGAPVVHAGVSYDSVLPDFIVTAMPSGMRGLMIAAILAIAMSNASGSLNSLAASSVLDFQELRGRDLSSQVHEGEPAGDEKSRPSGTPRDFFRFSRGMTLVWGALLALLGTLNWGPMLEAGLTIASITFGILLGLFLLAFLFQRATARGVLVGMFTGLAGILYIHFRTPLLWTWYVPAGTFITFLAGAMGSYL
ncbi:MAG: sodium:solute symporter [Acidobacteriia bacterium]|nr:sodium:solute symporter [Terriglobia bacterium]